MKSPIAFPRSSWLLYILLALSSSCLPSPSLAASDQEASPPSNSTSSTNNENASSPLLLRWASTGGGWRSQFACVGFANLFANTNININYSNSTDINTNNTNTNINSDNVSILSQISAISTTSGASWFSTQLFYSNEFYNRVVHASDGQAVYDFVVDWMNAYLAMSEEVLEAETNSTTGGTNDAKDDSVCNRTGYSGDESHLEILGDFCKTLIYFGGDWAYFVEKMLVAAASVGYGDDGFGSELVAGSNNRVEDLKGVDLLIQAALVPNSRIRSDVGIVGGMDGSIDGVDVAVYLGHAAQDTNNINMGAQPKFYTVPISAAYIVNASGTNYRYSTSSPNQDLIVHTAKTSAEHSFSDWEQFHLYPAPNGTILVNIQDDYSSSSTANNNITNNDGDDDDGTKLFSQPFGGGDSTVIQVAAISSAAGGTLSPLVPSTFTQDMSYERYGLQQQETVTVAKVKSYDWLLAQMYDQPLFDRVAVSTQWPNSSGNTDGQFVDGWIADNPALVINVGQYHVSGGDLSQTMKVILTNTNQKWGTAFQYTQILQYFDSPINQGVEPGGFNWPPGMWVPYQSPQIFQEYMDSSMLDGLIEPMTGTNMTTAVLTGTTVDSPIFGIRAGQRVEILLINVNEPITTYVMTPEVIRKYTEPLATLAKDIAENEELASRISSFVGQELSGDGNDASETEAEMETETETEQPSNSGHSILLQLGLFRAISIALLSISALI